MQVVYLAFGSNVGDRQANLQTAFERLAQTPGVEFVRHSSFHESELVGDGPEQGTFFNGVAELRTTLEPHALLSICKALEAAAGRTLPAARNHPRPLDLDIVLFGDRHIDTRELVVPHREWHLRSFVTEPLQELGVDFADWPRHERARVVQDRAQVESIVQDWREGGCLVGVVPTMGSLHQGHASLMRKAREQCDRVLATVFVNPLQFGPGEDFAAYPRDLERDAEICRDAGVDVLFAPEPGQMFPDGFCSHVAVGAEAEGMEGAVRPTHFQGVATVVARLFALLQPHRAYFGEKDAQQLAVLRRMVKDLGFPVQLVPCPIVREADGLALSSRNIYLGEQDRAACTVLSRALFSAREQFVRGVRDKDALLERARTLIETERRASIDYIELRREGDLAALPKGDIDGGRMLVAARFVDGVREVRLLDNLSLNEADEAR